MASIECKDKTVSGFSISKNPSAELPPTVSVGVANNNGMEAIDDCLRSVLAQQGDISVEILVHDDASSDGSVAHIHTNYPDVVLIESDANISFCIANNRMVAGVRSQSGLQLNYICLAF